MIYTTEGLKQLDKKDILNKFTQEQLWNHYTGLEIQTKIKFFSPLRKEKNPSAGFYYNREGELRLKDFGRRGSFSIWDYIMWKFNLSYRDSLSKIKNDFEDIEPDIAFYGDSFKPIRRIRENKKIIPTFKEFSKEELEYWAQYYITKEDLDIGNVRSLDHYWVVGEEYSVKFKEPFTFCYLFSKDEYKIYKPFNKDRKFYFYGTADTLQGEHMLPWLGDLLIITKAMKDVLVLNKLGYSSIGFQGENSFPSKLKISTLQHRFTNIITLFDNDKAGRNGAETLHELYGFKYFFLDEYKDISDFIKNKGIEKTKEILCLNLDRLLG